MPHSQSTAETGQAGWLLAASEAHGAGCAFGGIKHLALGIDDWPALGIQGAGADYHGVVRSLRRIHELELGLDRHIAARELVVDALLRIGVVALQAGAQDADEILVELESAGMRGRRRDAL